MLDTRIWNTVIVTLGGLMRNGSIDTDTVTVANGTGTWTEKGREIEIGTEIGREIEKGELSAILF